MTELPQIENLVLYSRLYTNNAYSRVKAIQHPCKLYSMTQGSRWTTRYSNSESFSHGGRLRRQDRGPGPQAQAAAPNRDCSRLQCHGLGLAKSLLSDSPRPARPPAAALDSEPACSAGEPACSACGRPRPARAGAAAAPPGCPGLTDVRRSLVFACIISIHLN